MKENQNRPNAIEYSIWNTNTKTPSNRLKKAIRSMGDEPSNLESNKEGGNS